MMNEKVKVRKKWSAVVESKYSIAGVGGMCKVHPLAGTVKPGFSSRAVCPIG
jgi:hypothetical protein